MVDNSRIGGLQTFSVKDKIVNTGVGENRFTVAVLHFFVSLKLL